MTALFSYTFANAGYLAVQVFLSLSAKSYALGMLVMSHRDI